MRLSAALLLGVAVVSLNAPAALAQPAAGARRDFAIAAQPLVDAMREFSRVTGVQVVYAAAIGGGVTSPGVSGSLAAGEALSRLLTGTGLTYRFTGPNAVTLDPAPQASGAAIQLGPVRVEGSADAAPAYAPPQAEIGTLPPVYAGGQVARGARIGVLGNRDFLDTPFSQSSFTEQLIADQQAQSVADVLRNDPAVLLNFPSATASGTDYFSIRGFEGTAPLFNGLPGIAPYNGQAMGVQSIERIEILRGPSALLNGVAGNIGGLVNIVPKRAEDEPILRFTGLYGSESQFGGHVDVGRRFGADKAFGVRVNAAYREGDSAIDHLSQEFKLAAIGLDWRGSNVRLAADLGYQRRATNGTRWHFNLAPGVALPKAPDNRTNVSAPWELYDDEAEYAAGRAEVDLAPNVTAFAGAGYNHRRNRSTYQIPYIIDEAGSLSPTSEYLYGADEHNYAADSGVRADLDFGGMRHQFVASYSWVMSDSYQTAFNVYDIPASNLYRPVFAPPPPQSLRPDFSRTDKAIEDTFRSFMVGDTLSVLDERVQLTAGVRWQNVKRQFFDMNTGAVTSRYDESAVTPTFGLLVKPADNVSLYANYIEALQQGLTAPDTAANAREVFAPYATKGYEIGAKADFGKVGATLALYQMSQPSGVIDPVTNRFEINGDSRHRGVELNVFGEVAEGVRIIAGASYIDARLVKTDGGINQGNKVTLPPFQAVLSGEWDLPFAPGLTLTSRLMRASSQFLDPENTRKVPSWAQWDLGARYRLRVHDQDVVVRLTVENVADSKAWSGTSRGTLLSREPRTVQVSASLAF